MVAQILTQMAAPPNARQAPRQQDVKGDFDLWFDGGAVKHDTGISDFRLADGSAATTGSSLWFAVLGRLADGRFVEIRERDRDRLNPLALIGLE